MKKLLRVLAAPLALEERPFRWPALRLDLEEKELLALLRRLKKEGVVKRVGAAVNHYRAGYRHNALVAWQVEGERQETLGRRFASCAAVSHCYLRRPAPGWPYALYTMVHGRSKKECLSCIRAMAEEPGIAAHRVLFTLKEYKKVKTDIRGILK